LTKVGKVWQTQLPDDIGRIVRGTSQRPLTCFGHCLTQSCFTEGENVAKFKVLKGDLKTIMRRSAVPEHRVLLSQQNDADKSSESNPIRETEGGDDKDAFPENSWAAWSCLLGSYLMMFPSFGFQTAGKELV
jgi:hypothetical protein